MAQIELNQVCLDYIVKSGSQSIKKTAIYWFHALFNKTPAPVIPLRNSSFRALNNINLTIDSGDRIGLLGRNGAGKSTLLRVLAKVYTPSSGTISVGGKTANLFNVCLGMEPEATGYENILRMAIARGMTKIQAQELIPDVANFTELGDFLHAPIRTYSSGMQMKLAFAVATSHAPEIVLVDEVIGAGDAHFMSKATKRLTDLINTSKILVLTSHSNDIIRQFCNKTVVLDRGVIQFIGDTEEGIQFYENFLQPKHDSLSVSSQEVNIQ